VLNCFVAAYFWLGGLAYLTLPLWWEIFHRVPVHVGGVTQPDPVTMPGPFGHLHVLTLPGAFALIPIGAVAVLAAPWATRAATALDRSLIRSLLGPASLSERVHDLEQTRAQAVDDSAARLRDGRQRSGRPQREKFSSPWEFRHGHGHPGMRAAQTLAIARI
jgi:hypothetical protein